MDLKEQNILFFTRTMGLGGTENVVLQLCEIFSPLVNKIVVCSCGGVNEKKLSQMGIKHYKILDIQNKTPYSILNISRLIKKVVNNEEITVVHTHHRMAAFYVSAMRLYRKRIFINTSHNTFKDRRRLTQFAYANANLVACGEMVKKNLVNDFGIPDEQVEVIHNAVKPFDGNIVKDKVIAQMHLEGCFVIGNIGRLSEQKGMIFFLNAIPFILQKYSNARFIIVGVGEEEEQLKELVTNLKIDKYVYFLGYRQDIQNLMSQLDLVVLSSLWEGLPLTPIEAFSVGKTIVATAVDGTVEVVQNNENGFLVEPRSSKAIAEKVCSIMEEPRRKIDFEKKAKEKYETKFSFEKFSESYIEYYKRL